MQERELLTFGNIQRGAIAAAAAAQLVAEQVVEPVTLALPFEKRFGLVPLGAAPLIEDQGAAAKHRHGVFRFEPRRYFELFAHGYCQGSKFCCRSVDALNVGRYDLADQEAVRTNARRGPDPINFEVLADIHPEHLGVVPDEAVDLVAAGAQLVDVER